MMKTPDAWPLGALLPLTRKGSLDVGVLTMRQDVGRWTVVGLNIYDDRIHGVLNRGEIPDGVATYEYPDAEGVFDGGWRVS